MATTIKISDEQWKKLSGLRKNPKETFIDVLNRILKIKKDNNKEVIR